MKLVSRYFFSLLSFVIIFQSCKIHSFRFIAVCEYSEGESESESEFKKPRVIEFKDGMPTAYYDTPEWEGASIIDSSHILYGNLDELICTFDICDLNENNRKYSPASISLISKYKRDMRLHFIESCNDSLFCAMFTTNKPVYDFDSSIIKKDENFYGAELIWIRVDNEYNLEEIKRTQLLLTGEGIVSNYKSSIFYPNGNVNMDYPIIIKKEGEDRYYPKGYIDISTDTISYKDSPTISNFSARYGTKVHTFRDSISFDIASKTYTYKESNIHLELYKFGPQCNEGAYFFAKKVLNERGTYEPYTFYIDFKKSKITRIAFGGEFELFEFFEYRCLCD